MCVRQSQGWSGLHDAGSGCTAGKRPGPTPVQWALGPQIDEGAQGELELRSHSGLQSGVRWPVDTWKFWGKGRVTLFLDRHTPGQLEN